jgi:GxxExxY protein
MKEIELINQLTQDIIETALDVHKTLGPGLAESDYRAALSANLAERGFKIDAEPSVLSAVQEAGCRIDVLVEDKVILEIKAIDQLTKQHQSLLTSCLVLAGYEVGLLINFNIENLEHGIKRVINEELYDL